MKLNKPIYIGVCILELSKLHLYQYYYDVMKNKYDDTIKLLYTGTGNSSKNNLFWGTLSQTILKHELWIY